MANALESLFNHFWNLSDSALQSFHPRNQNEALQADLANRCLPDWRDISTHLATNPYSLTYAYSQIPTPPTKTLELPPTQPRDPKQHLELTYSTAQALVYRGDQIASSPSATPQVELKLAEMFPDSLTQLFAATDTIIDRFNDPPTAWLGTGTYNFRRIFQGYIDSAQNIPVLAISFIGKAAYYNTVLKLEGLHLLGVSTEVTPKSSTTHIHNRIIHAKNRQEVITPLPSFSREQILDIDRGLGLIVEAITRAT